VQGGTKAVAKSSIEERFENLENRISALEGVLDWAPPLVAPQTNEG